MKLVFLIVYAITVIAIVGYIFKKLKIRNPLSEFLVSFIFLHASILAFGAYLSHFGG